MSELGFSELPKPEIPFDDIGKDYLKKHPNIDLNKLDQPIVNDLMSQVDRKENIENDSNQEDFGGKIESDKVNDSSDIGDPSIIHITAINEGLEGSKYPGYDVEYKKVVFELDGETVEGVFPEFDSRFDVELPKELYKASDTEQFKYCVQQLAQRVENDPEFAKQFTDRQLEQIKDGAPRISGLTWHHNEVEGNMQLVDADVHNACRHTGGRSLWGGGSENR